MSEKKLTTPRGVLSFPALFKARSFDGQEPKFSATIIFDEAAQKTPEFQALKDAAKRVAQEKWAGKTPPNLRSPFRDGAEKEFEGYGAGKVFINITSKNKPRVVDQAVQPISEESGKVYPGCYVRASVGPYAYDNKGNKGVAFGLNNIQLLGDGAPLGGGSRPEDDFADTPAGAATGGDDGIPF